MGGEAAEDKVGLRIMSPKPHPPNHRNLEIALRIMLVFVIVCAAAIKLAVPLQAFELRPEQVALYEKLSLLNSNRAVRKIANVGPLGIQAVCIPSAAHGCNSSILNKQFRETPLQSSRIKFRVVSENPDFKVIYVGARDSEDKKRELSALYLDGFSDSDDAECQLYYSLKENVIEKVVIVISLNSQKLKQRFCLASQIVQGLGLSLPYGLPFSKLWKTSPDGLKSFTDEHVSRLTKGYRVLAHIHMCPDIRPAMKAPDIRRLLAGSSSCLDGLTFIPEQNN